MGNSPHRLPVIINAIRANSISPPNNIKLFVLNEVTDVISAPTE